MTRKQTAVAACSAVLFLALLGCTAASCVIYRRLLPEVEAGPIERREFWTALEAVGTVGPAESGRRVFCTLAEEELALLPEKCLVQLTAGNLGEQPSSLIRVSDAAAEVVLPYTLRKLEDGMEVSARFLLEGGLYDYVVPAGAVRDETGQPYLLTAEEVDGLTGPELRIGQFPLAEVLFSNGEFAAVRFHQFTQPPEEVVVWSSEPITQGDSAKWAEDGANSVREK